MNVTLPKESTPLKKYHKIYVQYLIDIFKAMKANVTLEGVDYDGRFICKIGDTSIFMDYSDHPTISKLWDREIPYFKFHCRDAHIKTKKIFPFPPISFYNWKQQSGTEKLIEYKAQGILIINKQRPYGNAKERRKKIHKLLKDTYKKNIDIKFDDTQEVFWSRINKALVAVFAPGAYNNMMDRGHFQYLSFGCCTISPYIDDVFPFYKKLIPGVHYLACKNDYSDLVDMIEWCKTNRGFCLEIGHNAKQFFNETSKPDKVKEWILQCLRK